MDYTEHSVRVWDDGRIHWLLNGLLHREGGPAIEWAGVYSAWYLNGDLHRLDGPAIECSDGSRHWYLDGKVVPEYVHKEQTIGRSDNPVAIDGKKYKLVEITDA